MSAYQKHWQKHKDLGYVCEECLRSFVASRQKTDFLRGAHVTVPLECPGTGVALAGAMILKPIKTLATQDARKMMCKKCGHRKHEWERGKLDLCSVGKCVCGWP